MDLVPGAPELDELIAGVASLLHSEQRRRGQAVVGDMIKGRAIAGAMSVQQMITDAPNSAGSLFAWLDRFAGTKINTSSPGYLAHVPSGGLMSAAVGEFAAYALNAYSTVWAAAPPLAELEAAVLRWAADMAGLPEQAGGVLLSGGSLANLVATSTARAHVLGGPDPGATMYASATVHPSVVRSARVVGIEAHRIRTIPSGSAGVIDIKLLRRRIETDRSAGLHPFLIVGTAGTTNTGAIDDLEDLATTAAATDCWLHVDAAYGGFFALTRRGSVLLRGLRSADSITLDPHKGLFLPYGTGCLLVRDLATLTAHHAIAADYLPPLGQDAVFDATAVGPELSRESRVLRVWVPLWLHGVDAFRDALERCSDTVETIANALRDEPWVEILSPPSLSIVTFRLLFPGVPPERWEHAQRHALRCTNEGKRIFMDTTVVRDQTAVRLCCLNPAVTPTLAVDVVAALRQGHERASFEFGH